MKRMIVVWAVFFLLIPISALADEVPVTDDTSSIMASLQQIQATLDNGSALTQEEKIDALAKLAAITERCTVLDSNFASITDSVSMVAQNVASVDAKIDTLQSSPDFSGLSGLQSDFDIGLSALVTFAGFQCGVMMGAVLWMRR